MTSPSTPPSDPKIVNLMDRLKLPYGGGQPPGGDMLEQRVKHLEDDMREVKADLKALAKDISDIKTSLGTISAKLDGKIDYKWMTIYILGIVAVILREEILAIFK